MHKNNRRGRIQTVTGLIEPSDLGPTLMHEHIVVDFTPPAGRAAADAAGPITLQNVWQTNYDWHDAPGNRRMLDREVGVREMQQMMVDGGRSVVEVSTHPMILDPQGLLEVSRRSGVHLVRGCGRYLEEFMDADDLERDVDDLVGDILKEIDGGDAGTGRGAGIIGEIGCSWPWTLAERRSMQAAVIAQQQTGAALTIHPGRNPEAPFEILEFIAQAGADLAHTIMDHIDRRLFDIESILRLADSGLTLEFDTFGWETSRFAHGSDLDPSSDGCRLTAIKALIDRGHADRIVIAHDVCQRTRQMEFGGHGYGHIYRNILPMMRRRGFTDDHIDAMLVRNPARLLAFV